MTATIILDHIGELEIAALMTNGTLEDLYIEVKSAPKVGSIYHATCQRPLKGLGGMIVSLPEGLTGFLRYAKGLKVGDYIPVQVTGYAEDSKAIPVTTDLLYKSRYVIVTPGKPGINISRQIKDDDRRDALKAIAHDNYDGEFGLILRSNCVEADDADIASDIQDMADLAHHIHHATDLSTTTTPPTPVCVHQGDSPHTLAWREWTMPAEISTQAGGLEDFGALDHIDALTSAYVPLGSAHIYIEKTRALVAVDVNTGGDTSPAAALKANLATCRALPTQLRLRGYGGQICIDFAPMPKAHRKQVDTALRTAFKRDAIETSLIGWTTMGLFELQRKRERIDTKPLLEVLSQ